MTMTTQAKQALSKTIRALRDRLLTELGAETTRVYRLSQPVAAAGLSEAHRVRRARLEQWCAEQARAHAKKKGRAEEDFRREAQKQAAYTLLNRLVILRLLEASPDPDREPLRELPVVTGGFASRGYQELRALAAGLTHDEMQGYDFLLKLVFEELAQDLPGLFGDAGIAELIPVPTSTLLHVVQELDKPELASCWSDDMTLGWVYQYWNDPEREALDAKLNAGGKVEPHEIASKTQLFTERYMVDWLLQNTLGPMWLSLCHKHGWTPAAQAHGTLDALEARRVEWRAKRDAGEVALTDLMPLHTDEERRWAYYLPPPTPASAGAPSPASGRGESHPGARRSEEEEPDSVREWKILDPAVGSGHFLVVALDLLWALYREEAQHRGLSDDPAWSDAAIAEHILAHNLHGVDLDPRAVQIAAASLWLKARRLAPSCQPHGLNLVASNLRLTNLSPQDPALSELRAAVERETGIPAALTDRILQALQGADHLGSLLKIQDAVNEAITAHERHLHAQHQPAQASLFGGFAPQQALLAFSPQQARKTVLERLEEFLTKHSHGDDLGLRLRGEQLAAGVRFVRLLREAQYDLVVANPPYQGTGKMADAKYIEKHYPLGKADLYAAFMLRGLELVRRGGISAMLTMRNWMFIKQYSDLRKYLFDHFCNQNVKKILDKNICQSKYIYDLCEAPFFVFPVKEMIFNDVCKYLSLFKCEIKNKFFSPSLQVIGDFEIGAFEEIGGMVVSVSASIFKNCIYSGASIALKLILNNDSSQKTFYKRAATLCHVGRYDFDVNNLKVVPEWPLVYWWDNKIIRLYKNKLFKKEAPARAAQSTGNNDFFVRYIWEINLNNKKWSPFVNGAEGRQWCDPLLEIVKWYPNGFPIKISKCYKTKVVTCSLASEKYFLNKKGIGFSMIGSNFRARVHSAPSVLGNKGSSIFPSKLENTVCALNSSLSKLILESLNPGIGFEVGDVNRLPVFEIQNAEEIFAQIESAFSIHESHREPSVEFKRPGPSPWRQAQAWAQEAVDREEGAPLPPYIEVMDEPDSKVYVSFALGVALGRFGAEGEGILDPGTADLSRALPHGILFLDTTLGQGDGRDGLGHSAAAGLHEAWAAHGRSIHAKRGLREWLAWDFFGDHHKGEYENRPIHWPLSSSLKTFVAWVNIHRWDEQTLRVLLADHLQPTLTRLEGELADLRLARDGQDKKAAKAAEARWSELSKAKKELEGFIEDVGQLAERGPTPPDAKTPEREQDARYVPDLDDGVMVNSAALWKILKPQWKDPEKWYKELASAEGKKDYDWSHLAMRYWPTRVDEKCRRDPSLAVAHGCFWRYHPGRAWAWELRLQDEISSDFRLEEAPYKPGDRELGDQGDKPHRAEWLEGHAKEALTAIETEAKRRMGRGKKRKAVPEMAVLERGFWSAWPAEVWELELRLSEEQGVEFFLRSPDEPEGRAAYEASNPKKVLRRAELMREWSAKATLFPVDSAEDEEDEEDNGEGDEGEGGEGEE